MRRAHKVLAGAIATWMVLSLGFLGYGWWTRQGAPTFTDGGAFGVVEPAPTTQGRTTKQTQRQTTRKRTHTTQEPVVSSGSTSNPDRTTATAPLPYATVGEYLYAGEGREHVTFGGASPCSWEIDDVSLVVNRDGDSRVFDWTFSPERVERHVVGYRPTGVYTEFVGSAVTCVGVRRTSEDRYTPPALRMPLPLKAGDTWHDSTQVQERHEEVDGRILRRDRITVPAGTFDVFVLQVTVTMSGSEEGTFTTTRWFAPALGVSVKETEHTDIVSGSAHFVSDMTLRLARTP